MTEAVGNGTNTIQPSSSNFSAAFPASGIAVGALSAAGNLMQPLNLDGSGNLKVVFSGSPIGTTNINLAYVGGTAITLGQAVMATSIPVVIASNQSVIPISNAGGTVALAGGTATVTLAGGTTVISGTAAVNLVQVGGTTFGLGQAVMATSVPVAIASNQSAIPVTNAGGTATVTLAGGTAQLAGGTATVTLAGGTTLLAGGTTQIWAGGTAILFGQAVMATSLPVAIASNQSNVPVNLAAVGGTAITLGQAVMATSVPVAIASNQSAIPVTNAGGTATVTLAGGTAQLAGGTATVTLAGGTTLLAGGTTQIWAGGTAILFGQAVMATSIPVAIASNQSNVPINLIQINGSTIATAGVNGLIAVGGGTASGSAVLGNPVLIGASAQTSEITALANGFAVNVMADAVGKQIVMPYAPNNLFVTGAKVVNSTTATTIIAAINATTKIYITSMQFGNTSANTTVVTLNDSAVSNFIVPASGGSNLIFPAPLIFAANTAVIGACSVAVGTCYMNAQGYKGQ